MFLFDSGKPVPFTHALKVVQNHPGIVRDGDVLVLEAFHGEFQDLLDTFNLAPVPGDVASGFGIEHDARAHRFLVFHEQGVFGNVDDNACVVYVVEGLDMLANFFNDGASFVNVALKVGYGPAFNIEDCPGIGSLGNEVFTDKHGPHSTRGSLIRYLYHAVRGNGRTNVFFIETDNNLVAEKLVGYGRIDERNHGRRS